MRFKVNGTKAVLTPASKEVEAMYLARPDKYTPIDEPEETEKPEKPKRGRDKNDDPGR